MMTTINECVLNDTLCNITNGSHILNNELELVSLKIRDSIPYYQHTNISRRITDIYISG